MSLSKIIKKFISFSQRNRLENIETRNDLLNSIDDLLKVSSDINARELRICLAHNNFEKTTIKDSRPNLHDTYISYDFDKETKQDAGYLIHFDQNETLHLVKDGYVEYQKKEDGFAIDSYEDQTTKLIIDSTIEELKKITPESNLNNEDKSLEWLKVTLLTLKKSLDKIDHHETILSYKIYSGAWEQNPILRVIIYNLDIKLAVTNDNLLLEVRNKEGRKDFDEHAKLYQASFKQLHNEVLNEIINLFIKLKEVRKGHR